MSEENGSKGFKLVDIEDLGTDGAGPSLQAWGYCTLKVQRGEETLGIRVRIESVPQEVVDALARRAPKPPSVTKMLDPSMPEARELGVTTRQKAILPDYNDPEYQAKKEQHDLAFRREIVGRGVASKLTLGTGKVAETFEERYQALEERGLSGLHFTELATSILSLTQWDEEERDRFLKHGSASSPAR